MPIPASWSKKRREASKGLHHISRPDVDNYAKAVLDACNGVLYLDDSQIADLHASKKYSDVPRVEVTMIELVP
jgi:Holliday junction resolvase RusA-like endonuclease